MRRVIPFLSPVICLIFVLASGCAGTQDESAGSAPTPATLTIFAAASLTEVLEMSGAAWSETSGNTIQFNFASSGTLARQVIEGAGADLFISGNREWMDHLVNRGFVDSGDVVPFLGNRLVVIAPSDSQIVLTDLAEITEHLGNGIAIGDPAHVTAGQYAREALERCGAWTAVESVAVRAVDVRAALAYVKHKEVGLGIVYATDVFGSRDIKVILEIPAELHSPAFYYLAPLREGQRELALAWLVFMREPEQATMLRTVGFLPAGR